MLGVGIVKYIYCEPFHDGVRIYWQGHNYVDSIGITYALQMASGEEDQRFVNIYRGILQLAVLQFTNLCLHFTN